MVILFMRGYMQILGVCDNGDPSFEYANCDLCTAEVDVAYIKCSSYESDHPV